MLTSLKRTQIAKQTKHNHGVVSSLSSGHSWIIRRCIKSMIYSRKTKHYQNAYWCAAHISNV